MEKFTYSLKTKAYILRLKDAGENPMKILPYDPKSIAGANFIDDSRLGFHVTATSPEQLTNLAKGIVLLGFADDTAIRTVGGRLGAAQGPNYLRQKLYRFTSGKPLRPIYDLGDLLPGNSVEETHAAAMILCTRILEAGHEPLVIGGGHDFGFPHALSVLMRAGKKPLAFLNIDAHLDVRPTDQGITSGSPWYLLREHGCFDAKKNRIEEFGIQPHCNAHALQKYAAEKKIPIHWLAKIRGAKGGAEKYFQTLVKKLLASHGQVLVSFDIDSVAWAHAPGCSAPQTVGFTPEEVIAFSRYAGSQPKVLSYGLFELSPTLDPDGRTSSLAAHCINAYLVGRKYLTARENS
jgi:formiminoglutamase